MKQFEYTIKAMSKLYASWAFFPRSTFSTAFQSVSWSAYSGGAWAGSRIAYDIVSLPQCILLQWFICMCRHTSLQRW